MEYGHQTASCCHCGKDTYESTWKSMWVACQCCHCRKYFMYKPKEGTVPAKKGQKHAGIK
jgi:hypothetical protein